MPFKNDYLSIQRDYQNALLETRQKIKQLKALLREVAYGNDGETWLDDCPAELWNNIMGEVADDF